MRNLITSLLVLLFISSLVMAEEGKKYGKEITLKEKTKVSDILSNPDQYEGKKVLIEGTVVNVCAKMGCWMEIAGDEDYQTIKVKVKDGEIVFPMEAKGKTALVEGEVYSFTLEDPQCSAEHKEGEEKEGEHKEGINKEGEEKVAEHKEGCDHEKHNKKVYQIKGIGAVIK